MKQTVKRSAAILLTAAIVLVSVSVFGASAKQDPSETEVFLSKGETMVVEPGETLYIPKGTTYVIPAGAELRVKGSVEGDGAVRVRPGGRLTKIENGTKTYWVGPKSDMGTKQNPVVALDKGAVALKQNNLIFYSGIMYISNSASIPSDFTWKLRDEVFLLWQEGVKTDVTIKGCKCNTNATQYAYDKVAMGEGSSNEATGFEAGETYWWQRNTLGKGAWVNFDYTQIMEDASDAQTLIKTVAGNPSIVQTLLRWSKNKDNHAELSTVPAWTEADGEQVSDVVYDDTREKQNTFDLYIPASAEKGDVLGLVVCCHGGGWSSGKKADEAAHCRMFARAGYATMTMDYRLFNTETKNSEGLTMYDMLDDIEHSIKKAKETLTEKGYSVQKMALAGYSAGGHMALLYGYARANTAPLEVTCILDQCGPVTLDYHHYQDSYLNRLYEGGTCGYLGDRLGYSAEEIRNPNAAMKKYIADCSPVTFINKNTVPTLLQYADYDYLVCGKEHSSLLEAALKKNGVPYTSIPAPKSDHPLELDRPAVQKFNETAIRYLNTYLK